MKGWVGLLSGFFTLALLILEEYFSDKARKREGDAAHAEKERDFSELAQTALNKLREQAKKDTAGAGNAWDQADQELKDGTGTPREE